MLNDESFIKRFWSKIEKTENCWVWNAGKTKAGYGQIGYKHYPYLTHRIAYQLAKGGITKGMHLDHLCRNRACCNPDHLEMVLPGENIRRGEGQSAINAKKTHCLRGHEFNHENTQFAKKGGRICVICKRETRKDIERQKVQRKNATHCKRGHRYIPSNTLVRSNGWRLCRICHTEGELAKLPKTHCKQGHEFTPENTYVLPSTGHRQCKECHRIHSREASRKFYAEKRLANPGVK